MEFALSAGSVFEAPLIGPNGPSPRDQRHWRARATARTVTVVLDFLFGRAKLHLFIDEGKVRCPLRVTDVDIEGCASCEWLERVDRGDATIVCRPILDRFGPFLPFI